MYEKPQYLTPDGFKRSAKNPFNTKNSRLVASKKPQDPMGTSQNTVPIPPPATQRILKPRKNSPQISEKAAKMIAQVLKGMLNESNYKGQKR